LPFFQSIKYELIVFHKIKKLQRLAAACIDR